MRNLTIDQLIEAIATSDVNSQYCQDVLASLLNSKDLTMQNLIQLSRLLKSLVVKKIYYLKFHIQSISNFPIIASGGAGTVQ